MLPQIQHQDGGRHRRLCKHEPVELDLPGEVLTVGGGIIPQQEFLPGFVQIVYRAEQEILLVHQATGREVAALDELARLLGLEKPPGYIESYDISNTTCPLPPSSRIRSGSRSNASSCLSGSRYRSNRRRSGDCGPAIERAGGP